MEELGFIGRKSYQLRFTDISELVIASMLISKIDDVTSTKEEIIEFSLLDFFPHHQSLEKLSSILQDECTSCEQPRISELLEDLVGGLFNYKPNTQQKKVGLVEYYNKHLDCRLKWLCEGDDLDLTSCILDFTTDSSLPLEKYSVTAVPSQFVKIHAENLLRSVSFKDRSYDKLHATVAELGRGVTFQKEVEFATEYFDKRQEETGEKTFEFKLKEIQFRHILSQTPLGDGRFTLPQPMTTSTGDRIIIPFYLEAIGLLDVKSLKIGSHPTQTKDIDIFYSVNRPAIYNKYSAEACGLKSEQRKLLNETQINLYERVYRQLQNNSCFLGRKDMETQCAEIFHWILRKVTYCLEEPSFLKEKSAQWLMANKDEKYVQMEDNFFLPFLHERLKEDFGDLIAKKPEKFGGEVDLLYSELPLELKVRKNAAKPLAEIVDDAYKPAGQAATYASITRLGFVLVLDLPQSEGELTNLDACFKVIEKDMGEGALKTSIVVCIFHCNLPKPSSSK
jgi:hypothetical protein